VVGNTDGAARHESPNLSKGVGVTSVISPRRLTRPALSLAARLRQHRRQKPPRIASRRFHDVFRWAPGDDFAAQRDKNYNYLAPIPKNVRMESMHLSRIARTRLVLNPTIKGKIISAKSEGERVTVLS
jgi:hypothetical protein